MKICYATEVTTENVMLQSDHNQSALQQLVVCAMLNVRLHYCTISSSSGVTEKTMHVDVSIVTNEYLPTLHVII